ncbi:MAG: metal ABC transporter substrate-binding protein, partial [Bacillota bacterium]|nr:metal ABC transporter substrate-binding protein [Bacillota bacterium]
STSSTSQGEGSTGGEGEGHEEGHNHGDHDHGHNHGHGHDHDHAHHEHPDEHVWTSPINAMRIVNAIAEELSHLDPANKEYYTANADAYKKELENLDKEYRMLLNSSKRKMIVFADRFPFRYLANEYQMEYVAAFSGCSTETEVSASVVAMLVEEVKEHEIPVVFKMEFSNDGIARAVSEASGAKILELHSAHNLTAEEIQSGETYLTLMRKNLEALKEALN